jgi:hypothetical protein
MREPMKAPENFAAHAAANTASPQPSTSGSASAERSARTPALAKKSGAKKELVSVSRRGKVSTVW